jgi:CubicO group peptidase (beta-lactamase class C family)
MRLLALLLIASSIAAQPYDAKIRRFEELVRRQMTDDKAVGMTIGFVKGDVTWVEAFGVADLENGTPARIDSSYRMASVTKTMTAAAILRLVEEGKLDLDAEVQQYVPAYPRKKHPVRIRQLLGHIGGMASYQTMAEQELKVPKTTRESIALLAGADLIAEPETRFSYSNYGFILLRAVVESVSGMSYDAYLRENVWGPLGMRNTRVDDPLALIPRRVRGYQLVDGKVKNSDFVNMSSRIGASGTRSTVPDLLAFARGLMAGRILAPATRERMWTSMTLRNGRRSPYGMGWWTTSRNGRFAVHHGGGSQETRVYLLLIPSENFAVAAAANFEGADPAPLAFKLYETILDERWDAGVYTEDESERAMLEAMDAAFDERMRYFDQHGRAMAIETFSSTPTPSMVSYMASRLPKTNVYYRDGAIALFADYMEWYRKRPDHPAALRFSESMERAITRWSADWRKSWNAYTRELDVDRTSDLQQVASRLRETFRGTSVRPNLEYDFELLARTFMAHGEIGKALEAARIAVELYPRSAQAHGWLAIVYAVAGDKAKALASFRTSRDIDPNDESSAPVLNNTIYGVASLAGVEAGLRLAAIALELHPRDPDLLEAPGELYLMAGRKAEAIAAFRAALAVDPTIPNAKQRLADLTARD